MTESDRDALITAVLNAVDGTYDNADRAVRNLVEGKVTLNSDEVNAIMASFLMEKSDFLCIKKYGDGHGHKFLKEFGAKVPRFSYNQLRSNGLGNYFYQKCIVDRGLCLHPTLYELFRSLFHLNDASTLTFIPEQQDIYVPKLPEQITECHSMMDQQDEYVRKLPEHIVEKLHSMMEQPDEYVRKLPQHFAEKRHSTMEQQDKYVRKLPEQIAERHSMMEQQDEYVRKLPQHFAEKRHSMMEQQDEYVRKLPEQIAEKRHSMMEQQDEYVRKLSEQIAEKRHSMMEQQDEYDRDPPQHVVEKLHSVMEQQDEYVRKLSEQIAQKRLVVMTGIGVSLGLVDNNCLTWDGLLDEIRKMLNTRRTDIIPDSEWVGAPEAKAHHLDQIVKKNFAHLDYRQFVSVIMRGVNPPGDHSLAQAISSLKLPIATTNYDLILDQCLGRFEMNLSTVANQFSSEHHHEFVYHVHGVWFDSNSVVMSSDDYERTLYDFEYAIGKLFFGSAGYAQHRSLLFVGSKGGIVDAHFRALYTDPRFNHLCHFALLKYEDFKKLLDDPVFYDAVSSNKLIPVIYGYHNADLQNFLEQLAP